MRLNKQTMLNSIYEVPVKSKMAGTSTLDYTNADGMRYIRYHRTDVVEMFPDGSVSLNSGGYHTSTTKNRMNEYLPHGYYVRQENYEWYFGRRGKDGIRVEVPFYDGISITPSGTIF